MTWPARAKELRKTRPLIMLLRIFVIIHFRIKIFTFFGYFSISLVLLQVHVTKQFLHHEINYTVIGIFCGIVSWVW